MTLSRSVATMDDMSHYQWKFLLAVLAGWINRHRRASAHHAFPRRPLKSSLRLAASLNLDSYHTATAQRLPEPPAQAANGSLAASLNPRNLEVAPAATRRGQVEPRIESGAATTMAAGLKLLNLE